MAYVQPLTWSLRQQFLGMSLNAPQKKRLLTSEPHFFDEISQSQLPFHFQERSLPNSPFDTQRSFLSLHPVVGPVTNEHGDTGRRTQTTSTSRAEELFGTTVPWALILTKPVPEVFELRPADWPEKCFSGQSAGRFTRFLHKVVFFIDSLWFLGAYNQKILVESFR